MSASGLDAIVVGAGPNGLAAAIDLAMSVSTSGLSAPPRAGDPLTFSTGQSARPLVYAI